MLRVLFETFLTVTEYEMTIFKFIISVVVALILAVYIVLLLVVEFASVTRRTFSKTEGAL